MQQARGGGRTRPPESPEAGAGAARTASAASIARTASIQEVRDKTPCSLSSQRFAVCLLVNQPQILISLAVLRGLQERRLREAAEREAAAEALAAAAVEEDLAATRAELATVSAELAAEMQPRAVAATA